MTWRAPLLIFLLLPLLTPSAQEVLIYRDVRLRIMLNGDGSATITYEFTLENRASVPVVPGYGYFNVSSGRIVDARAEVMGKSAEVIHGEKYARYSIWEVIRPGGSVRVRLDVKVSDFLSRGILFDEFDATLGPFSYPVEGASIDVAPGEGLHLVYLERSGSLGSGGLRLRGEVSRIPLPMLPFSWYPVFWGIVILALAFLLALGVRRS